MKKIIFTATFLFITVLSVCQVKPPVPHNYFKQWAGRIQIPGYSLFECKIDGAINTAKYGSSPTQFIQILVMPQRNFNDYKTGYATAQPYTWNGYNAVYYGSTHITFFAVEVPQAKLSVKISTSGKVSQTEMEEIAKEANIPSLAAGEFVSGLVWPEEIPVDMRISLAKSIKALGPEGKYKEVYEVKAAMGPQLVESVRLIIQKYKGEVNLISTEKLDLICTGAEDLPQLKVFFMTGETVIFTYNIK